MRLYGMPGQSSSMTAKPIVHRIAPVANTGKLWRPIKHSGAGSTQQLRQTGIVNHVGERQKVHQPGNAENALVVIEVAAHAVPQSGHQSESVGDDEGREQEHIANSPPLNGAALLKCAAALSRNPTKRPMVKSNCHANGLKNQPPSAGQVGMLSEHVRASKYTVADAASISRSPAIVSPMKT